MENVEIIYCAFCDKSENMWGFFHDLWAVFWKYIKSVIYQKASVNIFDIVEFGSWDVEM